MKTKSAVLYKYNQPLVIEELDLAPCREGEVLVRFKASGLCHSDLSVMQGKLPLPPLPCVPGHEGAGIVEKVGPGVKKVQPGDHVLMLWAPACGECYYCKKHQPSQCVLRDLTRNGTMIDGTHRLSKNGHNINKMLGVGSFSEFNVINQENLIRLDENIPFDTAAIAGCSVITGVGSVLRTAQVEPGSSVAIIGIGGVGINIVQGANLAGATKIIAVDVLPEKLDLAKKYGASHGIDSSKENLEERVLEITGGIGVDYAFEALGRPDLINTALNITRRGGDVVCVGVPGITEKLEVPITQMIITGKNLLGCYYGSAETLTDLPLIFDLYQNNRIKVDELISERYSLAEVNRGFQAMQTGKEVRGVIIFD